jgi:hypothetical protein
MTKEISKQKVSAAETLFHVHRRVVAFTQCQSHTSTQINNLYPWVNLPSTSLWKGISNEHHSSQLIEPKKLH